ncbi:hypothetical protein D3C72_1576160 [compost metagenome]
MFTAGDALAQPLLDLRRAGALLQPQGNVSDTPLVREPSIIVLADHDRTMLACVIAPHAAHQEGDGPALQRQRDTLPRAEAIEVDHRLADPYRRRIARLRRDGRSRQRQPCARIARIDRPGNDRYGGTLGIKQDLART